MAVHATREVLAWEFSLIYLSTGPQTGRSAKYPFSRAYTAPRRDYLPAAKSMAPAEVPKRLLLCRYSTATAAS